MGPPQGAVKVAEESKLRGKRPVLVAYRQPPLSRAIAEIAGLVLVGGTFMDGETPVRGVRKPDEEGMLRGVRDEERKQAVFYTLVSSVASALAASGKTELQTASADVLHALSSMESTTSNVYFQLAKGSSKGSYVLEIVVFEQSPSSRGQQEYPATRSEQATSSERRDYSYSIYFKANKDNTVTITEMKDNYKD